MALPMAMALGFPMVRFCASCAWAALLKSKAAPAIACASSEIRMVMRITLADLRGLEAFDIQRHGQAQEHIRRVFRHAETGIDIDDVIGRGSQAQREGHQCA